MKILLRILLTTAMMSASVASAESNLILENVYNLHPTQVSVGMASVMLKSKKIGAMSSDARMDYLKAHPVPVILGPERNMYLIDHHHLSRALVESGHKRIYVTVIADWSQMGEQEFWFNMANKGYTYLFDKNGKKIEYSKLPKDVRDLKDDPFRSLAYFAREEGAFNKSKTPFAEFFWAQFYKKYISSDELKNWKKATRKAVELSGLSAASDLPGYKGLIACSGVF